MSTPQTRATLAAAAAALALAAAWLVPPAAVLIVWPVLFVLPGWAILARLAPRLGLAARLGVAIVLSVALATHLVHWISVIAGGYERWTVFAAVALLTAPIVASVATGAGAPSLAAIRAARAPLLTAGAAALLVGGTLALGLWRVTPTGVYAGGSNWSDLGVHLSIAESLNAGGNFPPEVPYFAGVPLVYHWFADFHAGIAAEAAGLFSVDAMIVQSTVLSAALALVVYGLARHLLRGPSARRAAVIAAIVAVLGGGLGWVRLIGDVAAGIGSPVELVTNNSYDNYWFDAAGGTGWPYFRIPSVLGTGLLAHRATTVGLPLFAAAVLVLVVSLPTAGRLAAGRRDRPGGIVLAGLLGALLAPFHFFFFPVLPVLAMAWVVLGRRLVERSAPRNALLFLAPFVLAVPFAVPPLLQAGGSGVVQAVPGWPSAPFDEGLAGVVFFYATNLGVPFVLALAALATPGLPRRWFLAAWIVLLFAIPNVVQLSVIDFDMNKYFQAMWLAVAVAAAWLVRRWPLPAVAAVLLLSVPSPLLVAGWTAAGNLQLISRDQHAAAGWVADNTPPDAVFATTGWVNSLTDAAGRKRLLTFAPYVANLGYDPDLRVEQVRAIYCDGDPARSAGLLRELGASYVVADGLPADCATPTDFGAGEAFALAYESGHVRIWRLTSP